MFWAVHEQARVALNRVASLISQESMQGTKQGIEYDRAKFRAGVNNLSEAEAATTNKDYSLAIDKLRLARKLFEEAIIPQPANKKKPLLIHLLIHLSLELPRNQ